MLFKEKRSSEGISHFFSESMGMPDHPYFRHPTNSQ